MAPQDARARSAFADSPAEDGSSRDRRRRGTVTAEVAGSGRDRWWPVLVPVVVAGSGRDDR